MEFLASLPSWAIMAIFGAIGGGLGGAIAWAPQRRSKSRMAARIVPAIAVAGSLVFANAVALPAIRDSAASECRIRNRRQPKPTAR